MTNAGPRCLECNGPSRLVTGAEVYPHRRDLAALPFWKCASCRDSYCGCHRGTQNALGRPAGRKTRAARRRVHAVFDPFWQSGKMTRDTAYSWLRSTTGVQHVAEATAEECDRILACIAGKR